MSGFVETSPTADAYWRSIILFGSNSATYKFALGKALLEIAAGDRTFVSLEDLAKPYARNLVEHLQRTDRQGTAASSRFLNACRKFIRGEITEGELVDKTVRFGFANVLDAFHMVNRDYESSTEKETPEKQEVKSTETSNESVGTTERRLEQNKKKANTLVRQAMRALLKIEEKLEGLGKDPASAGDMAEDLMTMSRKIRNL